MSVAREQYKYFNVVRGQSLLIHVVENNEIREVLLNSVRASGVDYLVREQTDTSDLVGKTFV